MPWARQEAAPRRASSAPARSSRRRQLGRDVDGVHRRGRGPGPGLQVLHHRRSVAGAVQQVRGGQNQDGQVYGLRGIGFFRGAPGEEELAEAPVVEAGLAQPLPPFFWRDRQELGGQRGGLGTLAVEHRAHPVEDLEQRARTGTVVLQKEGRDGLRGLGHANAAVVLSH